MVGDCFIVSAVAKKGSKKRLLWAKGGRIRAKTELGKKPSPPSQNHPSLGEKV